MDIFNEDYADDAKEVWEQVYIKAYQNKIIGKTFDVQNPKKYNGRYVAINKNDNDITISGETDFNFSDECYVVRGKTKYRYYRDILDTIADEKRKGKCIDLLNYCCGMTSKVGNFSLMQTTGALQTVKGTFTVTDRIDSFVYVLNNYYLGIDEMVLFRCTAADTVEKLKKYLDLFKDENTPQNSIYNYCKEVYHISSHELVDDLKKSGKHTICTVEELIDYMILAVRFWTAKSHYYKEVGISDKWKLKLVMKKDYMPTM